MQDRVEYYVYGPDLFSDCAGSNVHQSALRYASVLHEALAKALPRNTRVSVQVSPVPVENPFYVYAGSWGEERDLEHLVEIVAEKLHVAGGWVVELEE